MFGRDRVPEFSGVLMIFDLMQFAIRTIQARERRSLLSDFQFRVRLRAYGAAGLAVSEFW